MSGFCGWFAPASEMAADPVATQEMGTVLTRFCGGSIRTLAGNWGAIAVAEGPDLKVFEEGEKLCVFWGKGSFNDASLARLAQDRGIAGAVAQGYVQQGDKVLQTLRGHFALVLIDHARGSALLATDRMGTRPLCYATLEASLVFGSDLDAMSAVPGIDTEISRQAIYDYVYFHMVPGPRTIYAGRQRLLPGTLLHWTRSAIRAEPYWQMRFVENEKRPFAELKDEFLGVLRKSVAEFANGEDTGAFLSGGTDSSTLAGMLREVTGKAPKTYSIGFDAEGFDEMSYARLAARHFGTQHHEYYVTADDVVAAIPRVAMAHDQPFGNSSAVPAYYCAKLARDDGVRTMLGGDGGDELFGGNARYATQYLFSLYSDLPAVLRKRAIEPLVSMLPQAGLLGKAQRYIATASMPMPARYDNYNLMERLGPENIFTQDFLTAIDRRAPAKQMADCYAVADAGSLINRMLAFDRKYTLADNDLPKVNRSCVLAGVQADYPLLSDDLVDFASRLHPRAKLNRTRLRYFFKKALDGFLPPEIIRKSKHGFGLPFGRWFIEHPPLHQLGLDSLSRLRRRGIVRPQIIDELTSTHVARHADYFGTMVWVLMMLEQWFSQRAALDTWRH